MCNIIGRNSVRIGASEGRKGQKGDKKGQKKKPASVPCRIYTVRQRAGV
nr:MAG TPA: hypothetical protein [Caudoviricetes sp.]